LTLSFKNSLLLTLLLLAKLKLSRDVPKCRLLSQFATAGLL